MHQGFSQAPSLHWDGLASPSVCLEEISNSIPAPAPMRASVSRSEKAYLYAVLTTSRFYRSQNGLGLDLVLRSAYACLMVSEPGTVPHAWAHHLIACVSINVGRYEESINYGTAFLRVATEYPALQCYAPKTNRAIFHAYYQFGDYTQAIGYLRRAIAGFTAQNDTEEILRSKCNMVWALVKAGRLAEARATLPKEMPAHLNYLRQGALCVLLAAEGNYKVAKRVGEAALKAERILIDSYDGAEVATILAHIASRHGQRQLARRLQKQAEEFAALQGLPEPEPTVVQVVVVPVFPSWKVAPSLVAGERSGASFTTGVG